MWCWVRDWFHHHIDRLAHWWLSRPMDRLEREIADWMADNARRTEGP